MSVKLDHLDQLPDAIAHTDVRDIRRVFPNPTLIHIKGKTEPPLFLSTLLHGNETTSYQVLQYLQKQVSNEPPQRSLLIFVGNVEACEAGARHLDGQPDFNRVWEHGETPYHQLTAQVLSEVRKHGVFASIDIHNNTGRNPVYGCISSLRPEDLHLATTFSPVGVYYLNPSTTQSVAFSHICPAITLECGMSGDEDGFNAAVSLLDHVMELNAFPHTLPSADKLNLYETVGRVVIDPDASVSFNSNQDADIVFRDNLEALNFTSVEAGSVWAKTRLAASPMHVVDEHGGDLTAEFFTRQGDDIVLHQSVVPSMITLDRDVIFQDCLCYVMKRLEWT